MPSTPKTAKKSIHMPDPVEFMDWTHKSNTMGASKIRLGLLLPEKEKYSDVNIPPAESPRPRSLIMESERAKRRFQAKVRRRRGFGSTIMTRGGLGNLNIQKAKALGE